MPITITEALAEIKTISKRITAKREYIGGFLARQEGIKDPLEKDGGCFQMIARERQAIADLETRIIALRRGIQLANDQTSVAINGTTRTINDWLWWKRDVMPSQKSFLSAVRQKLTAIRDTAKRQGAQVVAPGNTATALTDFVVNINEAELAAEIEGIELTLGALDGQLSLKNATVQIVE
jgi:hypothetical protein